MNFAPAYLIHRFFYLAFEFFHHWYIDGSRALGRWFFNYFLRLDETLALKVTVKYFFQPLYKDYTLMGRILGFVFRPLRILVGLLVYSIVGTVFAFAYLIWVGLPFIILLYGFSDI